MSALTLAAYVIAILANLELLSREQLFLFLYAWYGACDVVPCFQDFYESWIAVAMSLRAFGLFLGLPWKFADE